MYAVPTQVKTMHLYLPANRYNNIVGILVNYFNCYFNINYCFYFTIVLLFLFYHCIILFVWYRLILVQFKSDNHRRIYGEELSTLRHFR